MGLVSVVHERHDWVVHEIFLENRELTDVGRDFLWAKVRGLIVDWAYYKGIDPLINWAGGGRGRSPAPPAARRSVCVRAARPGARRAGAGRPQSRAYCWLCYTLYVATRGS